MGRAPRRARWVVPLLLAVAAGGGAVLGWRVGGPPSLGQWGAAIDAAAAESGVDPALLRAMVAAESGGRAGVVSPKGARGLLQVVPLTAQQEAAHLGLDPADEALLSKPEVNLRLGASYLARLLRRYDGDEVFALAAYNAGPTHVRRWRSRRPQATSLEVVLEESYAETRRHVLRVLRWRDAYAR